jgi:beta-glucosidase
MDWADHTQALLQAWCPGQECGHAIADVLFGSANPSGRLPTSFPRRYEDNPAYINYPGENGEVHYGEGIFVGYRYYDTKGIEPLFPFGHGLSYTDFEYGEIELERRVVGAGEPVRFRIRVRNTGSRAGSEVVQVYVHDSACRLSRPEQELRAFEKLALEPGEEREVRIELEARALAFYDPAGPGWVAEPGHFELRVGRSSRDIAARANVELKG